MKHYSYKLQVMSLIVFIIALLANCQTSDDDDSSADNARTHIAQSVAFADTDMDEDQIAGTVDITKAMDESDVSSYTLYWGSSASAKLSG
jgi:hypothetical protein